MENTQKTFFSNGHRQGVADNSGGLSKAPMVERAGINIYIKHPKCGTYRRYLIDSVIEGMTADPALGGITKHVITTSCEACNEPVEVELKLNRECPICEGSCGSVIPAHQRAGEIVDERTDPCGACKGTGIV